MKPTEWKSTDLSQIELYSMVIAKRAREIPNKMPLLRELKIKGYNKIKTAISYLFYKVNK